MKIEKITSQSRNDFWAILGCEHCHHTQELTTGYDDAHYHQVVIPAEKCENCGKSRLDSWSLMAESIKATALYKAQLMLAGHTFQPNPLRCTLLQPSESGWEHATEAPPKLEGGEHDQRLLARVERKDGATVARFYARRSGKVQDGPGRHTEREIRGGR